MNSYFGPIATHEISRQVSNLVYWAHESLSLVHFYILIIRSASSFFFFFATDAAHKARGKKKKGDMRESGNITARRTCFNREDAHVQGSPRA